MTPTPPAPHRVVLAVLLALAAAGAGAQEVAVRYRSAEQVYLDAGTAAGLAVGDRLEVARGGTAIAELEVVFVAEHSASARIVSATAEVEAGDRARRLGPARAPATTPAPPAEAPPPAPPSQAPPRAAPAPPRSLPDALSGTLTFDVETFADGTDAGRDVDRGVLRLSLRGRELGGLPLFARVRLRASEERRARPLLSGTVPESESTDRLYELSLAWEPPSGRYAVRAGRLGHGPYAGVGELDGVVGEARVAGPLVLGAFFGRRPDLDSFGDGDGTKAGALLRLSPAGTPSGGFPWDFLVAGVREEGDAGVVREYLALDGRWEGARWTLFQYAELDVHRDGREALAGSSTQLSNVALAASARVGDRGRLGLSYTRLERVPTEEDRLLPEEQFTERLRQGLRVSYQHGRAGGWTMSAHAGLRTGEEDGEDQGDAVSFGVAAGHPRLAGLGGLSLRGSVLGFSSDLADGVLANLRVGRPFGAGHELALTVGGAGTRDAIDEERADAWVRLAGWAELPRGLFARGEAELAAGDDRDGTRLSAGLGVRF